MRRIFARAVVFCFLVLLVASLINGCQPPVRTGRGGGQTITCLNDQKPLLVIVPSGPADLLTPVAAVGKLTAMANCLEWAGNYAELNGDVTWKSSDTTVSAIEATGFASILATGSSSGTSLISATWQDLSTSATMTITSETLRSVDYLELEDQYIYRGSSVHLFVFGTFSDNATHRVMPTLSTWTSSNTGVATVDAAGIATGVSPGNCVITAITGALSSSTTLTVSYPPQRID